jgi:molybdopterin converting factor small subunit
MARVFIPALLQPLTSGKAEVEAEGSDVRALIDSLESQYPGLRDRLTDGSRLRQNISVAVDGEVSPMGILEPVQPDSEVHFLAAIKGG